MSPRFAEYHEFVRVHRDPAYQLSTGLLILKGEPDGKYLVDPSLWEDLGVDITPVSLVLNLSRQGAAFLWPLRLPRAAGVASTSRRRSRVRTIPTGIGIHLPAGPSSLP
jgi:hypothetical protein